MLNSRGFRTGDDSALGVRVFKFDLKRAQTMKSYTFAAWLIPATAVCVTAVTAAEETKQPLRKAKVGDYVVFKLSGVGVQGTMRQEVVAVTDKQVTIKTTSTTNGFTLPASEQTVDIDSKYDPAVEAKNRQEFKVVDTGKGQETLKIGGKAYACDWTSNSTTVMQGGMKIVTEAKVWISMDAPVYGLVKTENKTFGQTTVMELTESGGK